MGNKYYDLAPGNVLQNMYIKQRLKSFAKPEMKFIEVGAGNGNISRILLEHGLSGIGYDLNDIACSVNRENNIDYIQAGSYDVRNSNFFDIPNEDKVDIIISSHVLEHFPPETLIKYFDKCKDILNNNGRIITLVPSCMKYWGIEDETVGHYRRFEFDDFEEIAEKHNLKIEEISGLTYPLSNLLFILSNYLIRKNESWKINNIEPYQFISLTGKDFIRSHVEKKSPRTIPINKSKSNKNNELIENKERLIKSKGIKIDKSNVNNVEVEKEKSNQDVLPHSSGIKWCPWSNCH